MSIFLRKKNNFQEEARWFPFRFIYTLYLQNAVVERTFSLQNILITPRRSQLLLATVGKKVLLKYCSFFLSEEEIEKIISDAAFAWCSTKNRRNGF